MKYQEPKARLASILPSRPVDEVGISAREVADMDDDLEDEGTWNRDFVKKQSRTKTIRGMQGKKKSGTDFVATV